MEHLPQNLKRLLELTIEKEASDLHLVADYPPILRLERRLQFLEKEKVLTSEQIEEFAFSLLSEDQQKIFLQERELDFSFEFEKRARFRINVFYQLGKISLAFRLIPFYVRTIKELNLPSLLYDWVKIKQGFILICGPSSHGKSTTLAALLEEINQREARHIITIEDPIEYVFQPKKSVIEQREVGTDTRSFVRALRAVFRQDPDVIMIGEMRDPETMSIALTAAETGHLVFATLHTNSAAQTITRIVDSFLPEHQNQVRVQLAGSLYAIISLRLVNRLKGGLVPAYEILINTPAVSNLIRENKIHEIPNVIETSSQYGMISLDKCLAQLVKKGEISKEEALKYALSSSTFSDFI